MEIEIKWNTIILFLILSVVFFYFYRNFIFPVLLNHVMKSIHRTLHASIKKKAFKNAFERVTSVKESDIESESESSEKKERKERRQKPLEILEVGIGTGENFKYYPENAKLSYLDKTDAFLPFLRQSLEKENRSQDDVRLIVSSAENMVAIESNSKDVVVHTFILCSVDDPWMVLREIYRVLKPGGVCVFIEHSLDTENNARKLFQTLIGPLWYGLLDCRFRPMKSILEAGKYDSLKFDFHRDTGFISSIINPYVYGIGTKS